MIYSWQKKTSWRNNLLAQKKEMIVIKPCEKDADSLFARQLVKDYINWLNIDLSFQDIDKELSDLSLIYSPPNGLFY